MRTPFLHRRALPWLFSVAVVTMCRARGLSLLGPNSKQRIAGGQSSFWDCFEKSVHTPQRHLKYTAVTGAQHGLLMSLYLEVSSYTSLFFHTILNLLAQRSIVLDTSAGKAFIARPADDMRRVSANACPRESSWTPSRYALTWEASSPVLWIREANRTWDLDEEPASPGRGRGRADGRQADGRNEQDAAMLSGMRMERRICGGGREGQSRQRGAADFTGVDLFI